MDYDDMDANQMADNALHDLELRKNRREDFWAALSQFIKSEAAHDHHAPSWEIDPHEELERRQIEERARKAFMEI